MQIYIQNEGQMPLVWKLQLMKRNHLLGISMWTFMHLKLGLTVGFVDRGGRKMKYSGLCLAVKDVNRSKQFYQEIFGLEVYQDYGIHVSFGEFSIQQDFDWLVGVPKESVLEKSNNMELYFEEDNFDDFIESLRLRNDIEYLGDVKEAGWGQRSIKFYDPDGHIIEVGETLKMVIKHFLDLGMSMQETSKRMDVSVKDLETLLKNK